ncbi:MAG TPA: hypothetical protein VF452_23895 [Candidatus Binatia bacterium]
MTILLRVGLKVVIALALLCAVVLITLFFTFRSAKFKDWLETKLSEQSGFQIQIANLAFRLPFHVVAAEVQVSKPGALVLNAARLNITIMPFDALSNTLQRLDVENPVLQLDLEGMLKSTTRTSPAVALRHLNVREGTIVLKKGQATVFELPKINLSADNLNLGQQTGIDLHADLPQLTGELSLHTSGAPRNLEMEVVVRPKQEQSPSAQQKTDVPASEILRMQATLRAPENEGAETRIEVKFHELAIGETRLSGDLASHIAIDREWTTAAFSGRAVLVEFPKANYAALQKLPSGDASADFTGVFAFPSKTLSVESVKIVSPLGAGSGEGVIRFEPQARISRAKLSIGEIPWDSVKSVFPAPLDRWIYQGRGEIDLNFTGMLDALDVEGILRSGALRIGSENMNIGNLAVTAPLRWKNSVLRIDDAKLSGTQVIYGAKDQWRASAEQLGVSASVENERDGGFKITGAFTTGGGRFSSPDSAKAGENIKLSGPFEIAWLPGKASIHLNGNWRAESGEILWDKFFADLKTRGPALEVNTEYWRDNDRLVCHRCKLNLINIGAIDLTGSVEHLTGALALRLQAESKNFLPEGFFDFALRNSFNRQYPLLDKLSIQGQMTFQLKLDGALDALAAEGDCNLRNGAIRTKDLDWQIGPIALDLPFQMRFPAAQQAIGPARRGTLSIEKLSLGTQSFGPVTTAVSLSNNALQFYQPLHAAVFGGEIEIANLYWPDIISAPQRVSFSAAVKRLQLQQVTEALSWHPFTGTLTGSIPQVQSEENLLRTSGEIQAQVFGGRARIGTLEIENPFSSLPSIKLDASLDGIELEQLSKTFEFGRISGILEGQINDLVITDNQPAQFSAEFQSVDRGAEQRISVEALDKITVLSSGENAGSLYGGLAGFFDSFRYSKLGFKADLKNDRLTLRGVETRGDQEFLVVGSFLPPTVNIISHTQVIAFSELLRRLQSIKADSTAK